MTNKIANSNFKLFIVDRIYNTTDKQFYTVESYSDKNLYIAKENNIYRTKYNSCSVFLSAFETNINTPFEVEYTLYAKNDVDELIFLEKILAEDGSHRFTHLKKNQKYVIRAEDTLGKYISKAVDYISSGPTEDDEIDLQIIDFKDMPQLGLIFKAHNVLGEKDIKLENHPNFLKIKSLGNDFYQVYADDNYKQAYEFDIDITDNRPSSTVKFTRHFVINDGYSKPLNVSIEFLDNGNAILKWQADGTIDYYKVYLDDKPLKNHKLPEPVGNTGLMTHIIIDYQLDKTKYIKIGTIRNGKEKLSEEIKIDAVDPHLDKVELLIFANYGNTIKDASSKNTSFTINGNTTIVNSNKFVDDGALYVDGNGDGITIPITPLGESDFTFEYYFSLSSYTGTPRMFEFAESTGYNQLSGVFFNNTNMPYLAYKNNNVWADYGKDIKTIPVNEYHHYCVMRKNNVIYYFIDGELLTKITDTFPLAATHLYIGQTYLNTSYITGYYNSIRLTRNIARYNEQGFNVDSINIALLNKITKPSNVLYSIKDNNDLHVDIIHESNNVDNYSVYLEENEITSVTGLTPIATSTSKNIVIPNFDVYNNYDRTLKLLATTNKYNHSYLSENKDLYVVYDWTPDKLLTSLWLDSSDSSNIVITSGAISQWKDKSGNNNHFIQTNQSQMPVLNKGIYFNGSNRLLGNNNSLSISKAIDSLCVYVVAKIEGGQDYRTIINSSIDGATSSRVGIYGRQSGTVESFGRRIIGDSGQSVGVSISSKLSLISGIFDYKNAKLYVGLNGVYTQKSGDFQTPGSTANADSAYVSIGHHPVNNTEGFIGFIHEIIICKYILSNQDEKKMEGYLAHKYKLTDDLPVDHPYKSRRPVIDHTPRNLTAEFKDD